MWASTEASESAERRPAANSSSCSAGGHAVIVKMPRLFPRPSHDLGSSLLLFAVQDARDRELDIRIEEAQQAIDFLAVDPERRDQPLARVLAELGPCIGEPARAGRAVGAIEAGEVVDRQLVEDVLAQDVALADLERSERFVDRALELARVLRPQVLLARIRGGIRKVIEQHLVERVFAVVLAEQRERLAGRGHAQPTRELAAPRIVRDAWRTVGADQEIEAHGLPHLVL